jgi:hypothetical protein
MRQNDCFEKLSKRFSLILAARMDQPARQSARNRQRLVVRRYESQKFTINQQIVDRRSQQERQKEEA